MKITKSVARIVAHEATPTGVKGILIECNCGGHPKGNRAMLRESNPTPTVIHNTVNIAHSMWSGATSALRNGPWIA